MSEGSNPEARNPDIYRQLGGITRELHNALKELGYMPKLKDTAEELPDARSRLEYIARLTGEAAEKVLNQVDEAKAEQARVGDRARQLAATIAGVPGLAKAMPELQQWADEIVQNSERTDARLTEIMMAQDFHDLTGQVIKRVVALAGTLEEQLLSLLLEAAPHAVPAGVETKEPPAKAPEGLQGPAVNPEGRSDVVANQAQVDDLLASLGF